MNPIGEIAYASYCASLGGVPVAWSSLTSKERTAWCDAARAVAKDVYASVYHAEPMPETEPAR